MYTYQEEKNIVNALKHQCCLSQLMGCLIENVSHFKGFEQNGRVVFYQEQLHSRVNCALDEFVSMVNWIYPDKLFTFHQGYVEQTSSTWKQYVKFKFDSIPFTIMLSITIQLGSFTAYDANHPEKSGVIKLKWEYPEDDK